KRFSKQADRLRELLAQIDGEVAEPADAHPAANSPAAAVPVASPILVVDSVISFLQALRALPLRKPSQFEEVIHAELQGRFTEPSDLARYVGERNWLTSYQVEQLLTGHGGDLLLDGYLVLDRLGQGATGQVFKARHLRMDRLAAIKIIRPEL